MSKKTSYLLGILLTIILGTILYWFLCCSICCGKKTCENIVNHLHEKLGDLAEKSKAFQMVLGVDTVAQFDKATILDITFQKN